MSPRGAQLVEGSTLSHYLWLDLVLAGDPPAEFSVLQHGLCSDVTPEEELRISVERLPTDRWALHTSWKSLVTAERETFNRAPQTFLAGESLEAVSRAYGIVHQAVMAKAYHHGFSRLHAALIDLPGCRLLIAGASGAGKTSLALSLAPYGVIAGDEATLVNPEGLAIGLPRRLHVKADAKHFLPPSVREKALYLPYSPPLYALDPVLLQSAAEPTPVTLAPVDLIVILDEHIPDGEAVNVGHAQLLQHLLRESPTFSTWTEPVETTQSRLVSTVTVLARHVPAVAVRARSPQTLRRILELTP